MIVELIEGAAQKACEDLFGKTPAPEQLQVQKTKKEFEGDFTLVVFPLLKLAGGGPEQVAQKLGEWMQANTDEVAGFNVVKGFLNLSLSDAFWAAFLQQIAAKENYGFAEQASGKSIMVEYSSPNTNKPLHLGHLRNNFLGYSVSEILKANGHEVIKVQIINDRGIHICKSILAWQRWGNGETPASSGIKGDKLVGNYYVKFDQEYKKEIAHLVGEGMEPKEAEKEAPIMKEAQEMLRKWEAKNPEVYQLWEQMNGWVYDGFEVTYKRMGVDFDKLYYESNTYLLGKDQVEEGLAKGVFEKDADGSVWCDLTADGLDRKLVLRSDGTAVYMTQDIGTAIKRFEEYPQINGIVYTVGNEQDYHFKVLFLILKKLGYAWAEGCYHLSYGMVDLPTGKMKSREGTVVDADDLMADVVEKAGEKSGEAGKLDDIPEVERPALFEMLGLGAIKYYLLKVDPKRRMQFNPEESVDLEGNTAPFIQYTHARINSLLNKFGNASPAFGNGITLDGSERALLVALSDFPTVLKEAGNNYSPALIANYTYDLVKAYNHFYHQCPVLVEENEDLKHFRVVLSATVKAVVKSGMKLLGIDVPNKM